MQLGSFLTTQYRNVSVLIFIVFSDECSVPTVATSEKELEAAKEQADPRLSGPTAFMANSVVSLQEHSGL